MKHSMDVVKTKNQISKQFPFTLQDQYLFVLIFQYPDQASRFYLELCLNCGVHTTLVVKYHNA